ncbi:MAG: NAD(P)H-dependent glycerol-3-phosphate dehydrogenase [Candidatus Cyclobacteriaceae bacterium M3_2C_046]
MALKNTYKTVGVIGAGSFGSAIANILAEKTEVLLYTRKEEIVQEVLNQNSSYGRKLHERVKPTSDLEYLSNQCTVIFPIVPAINFRDMIKSLAPYLHPYHILIHGTKGLDLVQPQNTQKLLDRSAVQTMSEVIRDESIVVRIGCLGGPNLSKELADHKPAATVVASYFDEVIQEGQRLLRNDRFQVYGSRDLIGVELAGVLKNIIAIAAGAMTGMGLGENARALLISRGMVEMIYLGKAFGGNVQAFIGLAGIGDLIATCSSPLSRNFSMGYRLAQGESPEQIIESMDEVAEGINTIKIAVRMAENYKVRAPITETLYKIIFEKMTVEEGLYYLMKYPFNYDVDFI